MSSGILSLARQYNTGALYNVTDPITTAQGELVFTVWRKFFFQAGTVDYSIGGGTAVLNTDYDGSLSALSGTLTFSALEICKHVRIQTFGTGGATNKPASGAAQVTVNCTLSNATGIGRIEDYVGTGTIQSGKVFYYSASGSDGNTGTAASPFAYAGASNGIQAKITASNGSGGNSAGMLLRLNRGDTWTLTSASGNLISIGADKGGTVANPMIIGAYGSGENPIVTNDATYSGLAYFIALGGASSGDNNNAFIIEDLILQPGAANSANRDFIRNSGGTINPANRTVQRLTMRDPANFKDIHCGMNASAVNVFTNLVFQFNEITNVDLGMLIAGVNGLILGNHIHDVGNEPVRQWALYSEHSTDMFIYANKFIDNIQNVKLRSGTNTNWRWNYFDQTGSIGKASVTAATVATQSVFTISQDPTTPIPTKRLRIGNYFTLQGFSGSGWSASNSAFVKLLDVPVSQGGTLAANTYKTDWNTSTFGAFSGGTPTVYSGGNLNVAFGYDVVLDAANEESVNCTYENNVQIGSSGFGFGVAEGGVPAWGQGFINFTARNNLVIINCENPQGWNGGFGLFFNSPYVNGMQIYNNTFLIDGLDYTHVFMPFTQATGGNVGPIGPVYLKNNIFKRINIPSAANYLAYYGASSISGVTILGMITQDYNLWNDSTANKFASVNSGSNYNTLADFHTAFSSQETHGVSTSVTLGPYLGIGNFLPPNGSAAYGAGQSGLVTTDFIGNSRPTTPTIGGIEVSP